jgi:hypothetical protein
MAVMVPHGLAGRKPLTQQRAQRLEYRLRSGTSDVWPIRHRDKSLINR